MTTKGKLGGRIPASELDALKSWDFPRVAGRHVVRSPFKEQQEGEPPPVRDEVPISSGPLTVGEVEKIRQQARDEGLAQGLAEGQQKGLEQGLKQGQEQGYQAAYQQAEAEINDLKERLVSLQQQLQQPLLNQFDGLEQVLVRMVVDTAEAVTKQELSTRPELLQQAVREALDALPQQAQELCFYVHPDDQPLLEALKEQHRAAWQIATDSTLAHGGLRVQGQCSYLDYSVEKRFSQIAKQVLNANDSGKDDG